MLLRFEDVAAFLEAVGPFLTAREAEHNLMLGLCGVIRDRPEAYAEPKLFLAALDGNDVVAAALRTAPWRIILSETQRPDAVPAFLPPALTHASPLPGVTGPPDVAASFARAFREATGRGIRRGLSERIFRLTTVRRPPQPAGGWRHGETRDVDTIAAWLVAFQAEAVPDDPPMPEVRETVERWVRGGRFVYLWEDDGHPVSLVTAGAPTPNGIRIGPVYTPPDRRGRGYARALTAAASQDQLDRGQRFCFLYTDLANPTSNRIYQQIGYEPVTDAHIWMFDPPS